jgi:hypothetical protein
LHCSGGDAAEISGDLGADRDGRGGRPVRTAAARRPCLERIAETTRAARTDWALGTEARCRALLTDGDEAEGL